MKNWIILIVIKVICCTIMKSFTTHVCMKMMRSRGKYWTNFCKSYFKCGNWIVNIYKTTLNVLIITSKFRITIAVECILVNLTPIDPNDISLYYAYLGVYLSLIRRNINETTQLPFSQAFPHFHIFERILMKNILHKSIVSDFHYNFLFICLNISFLCGKLVDNKYSSKWGIIII